MSFEQFAAVLNQRACVRDFQDIEIPLEQIKEVLQLAARAPSSKNTQPWKAILVRGAALERLRAAYVQAFETGVKPSPDYSYSTEPQPDAWKQRARQVGFGLFAHKGIAREDKEKMHQHYKDNFAFFGAKQVLFLATRRDAGLGNFMDLGMFLGNILNGLTAKGWASCPSMSAALYPDLLREVIPQSAEELFVCGVPFGIASDAHVNQYRTQREDLDVWFEIVEE